MAHLGIGSASKHDAPMKIYVSDWLWHRIYQRVYFAEVMQRYRIKLQWVQREGTRPRLRRHRHYNLKDSSSKLNTLISPKPIYHVCFFFIKTCSFTSTCRLPIICWLITMRSRSIGRRTKWNIENYSDIVKRHYGDRCQKVPKNGTLEDKSLEKEKILNFRITVSLKKQIISRLNILSCQKGADWQLDIDWSVRWLRHLEWLIAAARFTRLCHPLAFLHGTSQATLVSLRHVELDIVHVFVVARVRFMHFERARRADAINSCVNLVN